MWELLKTVSLLKSELMKEKINPRKLIMTNKNCKKVNVSILLSKLLSSLKFFIEKKIIKTDELSPKIKE